MGRRGPKPTPKEVLAKRGSWRAKIVKKPKVKKRPKARKQVKKKLSIIKVGPDKDAGAYKRPAMPKRLTGYGRKKWIELMPILERGGRMDEKFRDILMLTCQAYDEYCQADDLVNSIVVKTANNNIIQHPCVSIRSRAWEQYRKALNDFGLTPAACGDVTVNTDSSAAEDKKRFFNRNKNA